MRENKANSHPAAVIAPFDQADTPGTSGTHDHQILLPRDVSAETACAQLHKPLRRSHAADRASDARHGTCSHGRGVSAEAHCADFHKPLRGNAPIMPRSGRLTGGRVYFLTLFEPSRDDRTRALSAAQAGPMSTVRRKPAQETDSFAAHDAGTDQHCSSRQERGHPPADKGSPASCTVYGRAARALIRSSVAITTFTPPKVV